MINERNVLLLPINICSMLCGNRGIEVLFECLTLDPDSERVTASKLLTLYHLPIFRKAVIKTEILTVPYQCLTAHRNLASCVV